MTKEPSHGRSRRPRRSCLAVPGSSVKMLGKAQGLPADQVFLDLEDAVAPLAKPDARKNIVAALNEGDWGGKTRVVRVNDLTTAVDLPRRHRGRRGRRRQPGLRSCCPRCSPPRRCSGSTSRSPRSRRRSACEVGGIGIEAQIENAAGLVNVDAIAAASPRVETIIFGPADFMASINMKSLVVGALIPDYPGDPYHYILMRILMAARMHDKQAIDGPFLQIRDVDAFREVAKRSAALGFDGKWVLHPARSTPPTRSTRRRRRTTTTPS